jgi:hypothetical protein
MEGSSPGVALIAFALAIAVYLTPSIIAVSRKHHQAMAIMALNVLLGWAVLGWIGALIWSLMEVRRPSTAPEPSQGDS